MKTTTQIIPLGDSTIRFYQHQNAHPSPFLIRLHGDELEASQAGQWAVKTLGGTFLDIDNAQREITAELNGQSVVLDPNRIFSIPAVTQALREQAAEPERWLGIISQFSNQITKFFKNQPCIVALHNNVDFNIRDYEPSGEYDGCAQQLHINDSENPHNLILVTQEQDFLRLKAQGINTVLKHPSQVDHPGSLSDYCQHQGIRYFNVEAYRGELAWQMQKVTSVFSVLSILG